jgi:hypothetical protein
MPRILGWSVLTLLAQAMTSGHGAEVRTNDGAGNSATVIQGGGQGGGQGASVEIRREGRSVIIKMQGNDGNRVTVIQGN